MPRLKNRKYILFDIDNTLFSSTEFAKKARKNAILAMVRAGLPATEPRALSLLEEIVQKTGPNSPSHLDILCKKLNAKNHSRLVAAGIRAYHDTKQQIKPYSGLKKLLEYLHSKNYSLCIATEGLAKKQWDKLMRLGLQDSFDHVFISEEIGMKKSPEFYSRICYALHMHPSNCIMVGDSPESDIRASRAAGLVAVRVLKGKHQNKKCKSDFEIRAITGLRQLL